MIFVTYTELRKHVDMNKLTEGVIMEAFLHLQEGGNTHFLFTNTDDYKTKCSEYVDRQGWNSETTLILFDWPLNEQEKAEQAARIAQEIASDPDWDDIQIGSVDPKQIICSFFPNVTLEKMTDTLNSFGRLKVFL